MPSKTAMEEYTTKMVEIDPEWDPIDSQDPSWVSVSSMPKPVVKGQIISECIYEIIDFPKNPPKNLIDFCPGRFYRLGTCDLF